MEKRAFLISAGLAGLAMYLVYQYIAGQDEEMAKKYSVFAPMVVSTRDILQYETIRPTDLETVQVPAAMVPPGLITNPKDIADSVAAVPILKGEQILDNKIISKNVYSGLDRQITPGKRAVSLPVSLTSSMGFMLRPGSRVDLGAYFEYRSPSADIREVKVYMQDLLLLATGRTIQATSPKGVDQSLVRSVLKTDEGKSSHPEDVQETLNYVKTDTTFQTITVEVTPAQAQTIAYMVSVYPDKMFTLLRHTDDRQVSSTGTTTLIDALGNESFLVRGVKLPPPQAVPRVRFYDYVGDSQIPVSEAK